MYQPLAWQARHPVYGNLHSKDKYHFHTAKHGHVSTYSRLVDAHRGCFHWCLVSAEFTQLTDMAHPNQSLDNY